MHKHKLPKIQIMAQFSSLRSFLLLLTIAVVFFSPKQIGTHGAVEHWIELDSTTASHFSGRNCHAMAVFKGKVWLTGGKSASYTMYNQVNKQAVRNEDVWTYTHGASTWQQSQLTGDFAAQNWDYLDGGNQAPWYSRFGHSLTPFDLDGDGEADLLVLIGGFSPDPSNDVWASLDGEKWVFVEHAPFRGRAWHGAAQHEGRLVVVGGTPLNNEVWITDTITMTGDYNTSTFHTNWYRADAGDLGWMPRAGFGLVPQNRTARVNGTTPTGEALYLLGGYGGWPASSKRYDGVRCRNDVWRSYDAVTWEKVTDSAGWGARAWMGAVAFHQLGATDRDVASDRRPPRLWVAGGGYMGTMANNIVRAMEAYADLWWSYDGDSWVQVSMTEGSGSNLYSTEEWALTTVDDVSIYIGKWGMQLVNFKRVYTETSEDGTTTSTTLPAMLLAGGDYADSGTQDSTVFVSGGGVLCSYKGVQCNEHGTCDEGQGGCTCEEGYLGAFCTETDPDYTAAAPRRYGRRRRRAALSSVTAGLLLAPLPFPGGARGQGAAAVGGGGEGGWGRAAGAAAAAAATLGGLVVPLAAAAGGGAAAGALVFELLR